MSTRRIKKFGVYQTAKMAALIYFFISLIFILPLSGMFTMFSSFTEEANFFPFLGGAFFLILPFIYGIMAFVTTAIGCLIYNTVAGRFGGIEVEIEEVE